ncbi:MAG TPA: tRNA pseudouridine(38-40) synthase TruA [Anaerolineales bacterium]
MALYKLILAYDGTAFSGSQRQANRRTVQGELEKALRGIGWSGRSVTLAGRTDTGVHASAQVAAFDLEWNHGLERLRSALNANLPDDMAVKNVEVADAKFHPRFDAASRCYHYRLFCQNVRDPLGEKMAWRVWPAFDEEMLGDAAQVFLGQHDFSAFGSPSREQSSTTRTVMFSEWKRLDGEWQYEVRADAFLYRMVRRLVFVQVEVAQGKCLKETVVKALERPQTKNEIPAGLAPAHGLTLVEVTY